MRRAESLIVKNKVSGVSPDARASALSKTRNAKMARSPHAYVRGNTIRYYEWLATVKRGTLPEGPAIWICGDCHIGNLGPVCNAEGQIEFQIRDLDETVIGNPAHDLIRLSLSLASAARGSDLPGLTTVKMLERIMEEYHRAFAPGFDEKRYIEESQSIRRVASRRRNWHSMQRRSRLTESATLLTFEPPAAGVGRGYFFLWSSIFAISR